MQIQPFLFFEFALISPAPVSSRGGKTVVDKLLKIRRSLNESEKDYLAQINSCIEEIRSFSRISENKLEEIILFAIERQGCFTIVEISEDIKANKKQIEKTINILIQKKTLRKVPRLVQGSDRQYFGYKSVRINTPEAG